MLFFSRHIYSTHLKPRRIHSVHTFVVEVIAQSKNKISSHLVCYFAHFLSCGLLHSSDVGGIRHTTPVAHCQKLNGGSVACKRKRILVLLTGK